MSPLRPTLVILSILMSASARAQFCPLDAGDVVQKIVACKPGVSADACRRLAQSVGCSVVRELPSINAIIIELPAFKADAAETKLMATFQVDLVETDKVVNWLKAVTVAPPAAAPQFEFGEGFRDILKKISSLKPAAVADPEQPWGIRRVNAAAAWTSPRGQGQGAAEQAGLRLTNHPRARNDGGQGGAGHGEQGAQIVAPFDRIHATDASNAARQFPDQPGVDRAQFDLAPDRPVARPRHGVQQPGELGRRKIGIQDQAGRSLDGGLVAFCGQSRSDGGGAPVLPDDGAVQGRTGPCVPHHGCLALVGEAHGGEPIDAARLLHHFATGLEHGGPDLGRIMLDPSGLWEMLGQFDLADSHGAQAPVADFEGDGAGRGRALVDGEDQAQAVSLHIGALRGARTLG